MAQDSQLPGTEHVHAIMQITIWGTGNDGNSEVHDYANKEWAGLLRSFYKGRSAGWRTSCL